MMEGRKGGNEDTILQLFVYPMQREEKKKEHTHTHN